MNNRGKLWVIPNDEVLQELFTVDVQLGMSHTKGIQEFSNNYQLGFNFGEDDY